MRLWCISIFIINLLTVTTAKRLPTVNVQKCCRLGEILQQVNTSNNLNNDSEDDLKCVPSPIENWLPQIYAPARQSFLQKMPNNWRLQELSRPFCGDGIKPKLIHLSHILDFYVLANGSLFVEEHHALYEPGQFCIDYLTAIVCDLVEQSERYVDPGFAKKKIKIRKCCGEGGAYSRENATCVVVNGPMGESNAFDVKVEDSINTTVIFGSGFPSCKVGHSGFAITALPTKTIHIKQDGSLQSSSGGEVNFHEIPPIGYCVERIVPEDTATFLKYIAPDNNLNTPNVSKINQEGLSNHDDNIVNSKISTRDLPVSDVQNAETLFQAIHLFSCIEDAPTMRMEPVNTYDELRYTLYPIGLVLSVIFLLATLAVGFLVPGNHHALHWRCQTYYVICLLLGDTMLAISQSAGRGLGAKTCVSIAILMHFFFLAAFFWLNTMCFNIWWTFRDFRPSSLEKGQESCRLRVYAAYAWGGPLLIAGCAALLDNVTSADGSPGAQLLRPKFGEKRCWFYGDLEILTFFYGPIGLLLFVNLLLFTSTARQLTCGLWKREEVKSTTERAALGRVCMKLVIVMGVTWIADVISWAVGGPHYIWYVTDLINAMQGVFIFIVVGCQPQVWAALKRLYTDHCCHRSTSNANGPQHSSSSVGGLPSIGDSVTHNTTANVTIPKVPMETVC